MSFQARGKRSGVARPRGCVDAFEVGGKEKA